MSFFDNVKNKVSLVTDKISVMSDEVVKDMDVDVEKEEKKKKIRQKKAKAKPIKNPKPVKEKNDFFNFKKNKKEENDKVEISDTNSVFELDNFQDEFFQEKDQQLLNLQEEYKNVVSPEVKNGKIQDILDLLQIPADIEIPQGVFMMEDLKNISFSQQAPIGYDFGEVDSFIEDVKYSVKIYKKILQSRNEDVANLATTIDKLQVDLNNIKYDLQIADGLNVMPTTDTVQLENSLDHERVINSQLRQKIKELEAASSHTNDSSAIDNETQDFINSLQDQLALLYREIDDLKTENYHLVTTVQLQEELADARQMSQGSDLNSNSEILDDNDEFSGYDENLPSNMSLPILDEEIQDEMILPQSTEYSLPEADLSETDYSLEDSDSVFNVRDTNDLMDSSFNLSETDIYADNNDTGLNDLVGAAESSAFNIEVADGNNEISNQLDSNQDSVFGLDDDDEMLEFRTDKQSSRITFDEDEDELTKLMKGWNK